MREEEGVRYLSPLVKQDLAKLDTDGDTRRLAVQSLKLFVEQLDASTLPRFISQIADSREPGTTRCYAISLYEEVARVHGKLVVPHISKVMGALVRSSSASGSFPQLQVACARVTAALARHGIDSGTTSQNEAEEIMREICSPLIDALAGKLEPVAATAAACIHALVKTEKWKHVPEEIVHDVCLRTTVALSEKPTRTAAHMHLIRILASVNPDVLCLHGASLLRAGEEILKGTANPWQLRKAAAQLLQSVLTILDKETLDTELNSALHVLDGCRLDKMPHVRAAVSEALHTAKLLASGNTGTHTSFGMAASPIRKTRSSDRSPWLHDDHVPVSPVSKRGTSPMSPGRAASPRGASPTSQESRRLSFSSASTSESVHASRSPARSVNKGGPSRAKRAPLYPARAAGMGHVHWPRTPGTSPSSSTTTVEECESPSRRLNIKEFHVQSRSNGHVYPGEGEGGHGELGVEVQKLKENQDSDVPLPEITRDSSPNIVLPGEDSRVARPNSSSSGHVEVVLPRLKLGGINSADQHNSNCGERTPMLKAASISLQTSDGEDTSSHDNDSTTADVVEVEKRQIFIIPETPAAAPEPEHESLSLKHFYKPLAHVDANLEFEPEKTKAEMFLPKRLVRSLSNLSVLDQDMKLAHDELITNPTDAADAETASETGWSVRDNPIASEESYRAESSDEETSRCSPREIRMISPSKPLRAIDRGANPDREPVDHPCPPSCKPEPTLRVRTDMDAPSGLSSLLQKDERNPTKCREPCDQDAGSDPSPVAMARRGVVSRVARSWKKLCWFTETALGGSLCVVIALPLAMLIVKALNGSRGELCHLVPT